MVGNPKDKIKPGDISDRQFLLIIQELNEATVHDVLEEIKRKLKQKYQEVQEGVDWNISDSSTRRRLDKLADEGKIIRYQPERDAFYMTISCFEARVPDERIIKTIRDLGSPVSTQNIADELGVSVDIIYERLEDMERKGVVGSAGGEDIEDKNVVWALSI